MEPADFQQPLPQDLHSHHPSVDAEQIVEEVAPQKKQELQLHAPPGWQKKITATKSKKDVSFVAPNGEEIKSKRALDGYLKKHPGGPAASEFHWSSGKTPTRRSSRLKRKTCGNEVGDEGTDDVKTEDIDGPVLENTRSVTKEEEEIQGQAEKPEHEKSDHENVIIKDEGVQEMEMAGGMENTDSTKKEFQGMCCSTVEAAAGGAADGTAEEEDNVSGTIEIELEIESGDDN